MGIVVRFRIECLPVLHDIYLLWEKVVFQCKLVIWRVTSSHICSKSSLVLSYCPDHILRPEWASTNSTDILIWPFITLTLPSSPEFTMHMAWVKHVCGRLGIHYCYPKDIVYNNFPWPESTTDKQVKAIEAAAQKELDARQQFPNSSLADLYDPLNKPPALVKAHNELD